MSLILGIMSFVLFALNPRETMFLVATALFAIANNIGIGNIDKDEKEDN